MIRNCNVFKDGELENTIVIDDENVEEFFEHYGVDENGEPTGVYTYELLDPIDIPLKEAEISPEQQAIMNRQELLEDCIAELAMTIYA